MNLSHEKIRRRRRGASSFNPSHDDLKSEMDKYLNKGGEIEVLPPEDENIRKLLNRSNPYYGRNNYFLIDENYAPIAEIEVTAK